MKHLKMLGLAAVAAAALTAFAGAGTAAANTVLCETTLTSGCAAGGWDWTTGSDLPLGSTNTLRVTDTSGFVTIATCTGGSVTATLTTTTTPQWSSSAGNVTWSSCAATVHTITGGEYQIHHIAGTHNGTLTGKDFGVTTKIGPATCTYGLGSSYVDIGTFIGSSTGTGLILHLNVPWKLLPEHSSASGCASSSIWRGTYEYTGTTHLHIAES